MKNLPELKFRMPFGVRGRLGRVRKQKEKRPVPVELARRVLDLSNELGGIGVELEYLSDDVNQLLYGESRSEEYALAFSKKAAEALSGLSDSLSEAADCFQYGDFNSAVHRIENSADSVMKVFRKKSGKKGGKK